MLDKHTLRTETQPLSQCSKGIKGHIENEIEVGTPQGMGQNPGGAERPRVARPQAQASTSRDLTVVDRLVVCP